MYPVVTVLRLHYYSKVLSWTSNSDLHWPANLHVLCHYSQLLQPYSPNDFPLRTRHSGVCFGLSSRQGCRAQSDVHPLLRSPSRAAETGRPNLSRGGRYDTLVLPSRIICGIVHNHFAPCFLLQSHLLKLTRYTPTPHFASAMSPRAVTQTPAFPAPCAPLAQNPIISRGFAPCRNRTTLSPLSGASHARICLCLE